MPGKKYDIIEYAYGLCSDPNVIKSPQGALSTCDNVRIQRDGVVEPINGADPESVNGSINTIHRIVNYDNDLIMIDLAGYVCAYSDQATEIQDYDSVDHEFLAEHLRFVELNSNLYFPTSKGVQKLTAADDANSELAGVLCHLDFRPGTSTSLGYGDKDWFLAGNCCAYRATVVREDANGNIIESAPTNSNHVYASAINDGYGDIDIYFGSTIIAGDKIRIYRTRQSLASVGPPNTFYKVDDITLTSSDITSGTVTYKDYIEDNSLGFTLYTDSSQFGYDQRNETPPKAKEMSVFNGRMFYSNYTLPDRVSFQMGQFDDDLTGNSSGAGVRQSTGDFTSGSPTVTNVASYAGMERGQLLIGDQIPDDTYIASISGSTITMTENATGTASTDTFQAIDTIFIVHDDGYETYAIGSDSVATYVMGPRYLIRNMIDNTDSDFMAQTSNPVLASGTTSYIPTNTATVEIRAINPVTPFQDGGFAIYATHGEDYRPELVQPSSYYGGEFSMGVSSLTSEAKELVGNTMWSRFELPEAVPEINSARVGDGAEILRTIVLGDSLIYFTKSGLYVAYGTGQGFQIRQHPKPHYVLVRPDAAIAVDGFIYAITDSGFVKINATDVMPLSEFFIHHEIKSKIAALMTSVTTTYGCWVEYSEKYNEIYFGLPDSVGDAYVTKVYVYNTITEVFYTLTPVSDIYHIQEHRGSSLSVFMAGDVWESGAEILWVDNDIPNGTNERSKTISTKVPTTVVNFSTAHDAVVGDVIIDSAGLQFVVVTVVNSTRVTVADNTNMTTGACTILTPITSSIIWLPKYGETRALRKHFVANSWIFESLDGQTQYYYTLDGSGQDYGPITLNDTTSRVHVPISSKRKLFLSPGIFLSEPDRSWKLAGLGLEYYYQGPLGVKNAQT